MAVHILSLLATGDGATLTSERMAGSINTNPVVVRKIMGMLKKAGFLNVRAGTGGAYLLKNIEDISLLDVYRAVEVVEEHDLFNFHDNPNPDCPVGANIESVFRSTLLRAQSAMEQVLADVPLKQLVHDLNEKISSSES